MKQPWWCGVSKRQGFALLAVLWIIVSIGVLALSVGRVGRRTLWIAQEEHDRIAGRWVAEGCITRWRAITNAAMQRTSVRVDTVWKNLFARFQPPRDQILTGCHMSMQPDGRVALTWASKAVLDSLPGMTPEAVARIIQMRMLGQPLTDLIDIERMLSPEAKAIFRSHYQEFNQKTTIEPDAWIVRAHVHIGTPPRPTNIAVRFVRAGNRAAITRWVEW